MVESDQNQLISGTVGYGLITREPLAADPSLHPYTAGRPTSRAIQWCIVLLVCGHCIVSYAPITAIFPCLGRLGGTWGTPYIQNQPSGHMGVDVGSHDPPGAPLPPAVRPWGLLGAQE